MVYPKQALFPTYRDKLTFAIILIPSLSYFMSITPGRPLKRGRYKEDGGREFFLVVWEKTQSLKNRYSFRRSGAAVNDVLKIFIYSYCLSNKNVSRQYCEKWARKNFSFRTYSYILTTNSKS
jgi:hypothetical protein